MPTATICLDCNRLFTPPTDGTPAYGRCPECRRDYHQRTNQARGPRPQARRNTPKRDLHRAFYASTAWRKLRRTIIARDGTCTHCGTTDHLQVHHITSIENAPHQALDPDNLTTVCKSCHARIGNASRTRTTRRGGVHEREGA